MDFASSLPILMNMLDTRRNMLSAKDLPQGIIDQINLDISALEFAINDIKSNVDHVVMAIGNPELVKKIMENSSQSVSTIEMGPNISAIVSIEPTAEFVEKYKSSIKTWDGNVLSPDLVPNNVVCPRYYAIQDKDGKRAILFEIYAQERWSTVDLVSMANGIFNSVKWR